MVASDENHNKYYRMTANGDGTWSAQYGRVGSTAQKRTYSNSQWQTKYNEKIRKGYIDQTDLVSDLVTVASKSDGHGYKTIDNKSIAEIVRRLQQLAREAISENYSISSNKVTQSMIKEAQQILSSLGSVKNVDEFNETLLKLFTVIPRKMGKVKDYLASSSKDFSKILESEQDLLDVMKGQVIQHSIEKAGEPDQNINPEQTILGAMGLEFEECTCSYIQEIKKLLGDCSGKFHAAWRVRNIRTQERFDRFCEEENIVNRKMLWHGSRNENWWSIINTGLMLRPNAVINGKMFGQGIYFAPKARKSMGYTSLKGAIYTNGTSNYAFMAVMDVAYGNPYNAYSFDNKYYSFNYQKLREDSPGANCLHAHAGRMLVNDEIIVYREDQVTIKYLVELRIQ